MKWAPEKLAMLRLLAPSGLGSAAIGERIGVSAKAVRAKAGVSSIHIRPPNSAFARRPPTPPDMLRGRWAKMIGPMKAQLRAEIAAGIAAE